MIFLSFRGLALAILTCVLILSVGAASAQQAPAAVTLFNNVRVFDGKSAVLVRADQRAGSRQPDRKNFPSAHPR